MVFILAEGEAQGRRLAEVLSEGRYQVKEFKSIRYFAFEDVTIVPMGGPLIEYGLKGLRKAKLQELPLSEVAKTVLKKHEDRLDLIAKAAKGHGAVVVATDYDREGEAIGYDVVQRIAGKLPPTSINRMYFSTLTESEVKEAYSSPKPMNEELLAQGIADAILGLNLTKALTLLLQGRYLLELFRLGRLNPPYS